MNELRFALRSLLKTPGFATITILTLALGIGATTVVFSWIDRVLLNPLPGIVEPGRVVALETRTASGQLIDTSYADAVDYDAQSRTLSHILLFKERPLNLGTGRDTERIWGEMVSANFFEALGVRPLAGRFFVDEDRADQPSAEPVAVISEALWRRRFNADPTVLGTTIKLNQQDFTVIGVAPASFLGTINGLAFDTWVPLRLHARLMGPSALLEERGYRSFHTLARLAPGASLQAASAELETIASRLAAEYPKTNKGIRVIAMQVTDSPHGVHRMMGKPLLVLLGVCGLLVSIVCANVSNLLLVRASARRREISIRQALGAGRLQIMRQIFAETLILALVGAAAGVVLTVWMADILRLFVPAAGFPISLSSDLNFRVLGAATTIAALVTLGAGLAPALWAVRPELIDVLRATGRAATVTSKTEAFRGTLVVAQVAIALVTLACAALALKSFEGARGTYPGFDAKGVLLGGVQLETSGYTRVDAIQFADRLLQRVAVLPGVREAALAEDVPLGLDLGSWETLAVPGYTSAVQEDLRAYRNLISPGYFSLMRIPLLAGRDFTDADSAEMPSVAVISATFARRYFGTTDAVGRTFAIRGGSRTVTIVGVAKDIKVHRLDEQPQPYFYVPLRQFMGASTGFAVHLRTDGDPVALIPSLRAVVREIDPAVGMFETLPLEEYTSTARFAQKAAASLLGVLSTIAVGLAALGLYGVLAFAVSQRTAEIGVRLALGAQPRDIMQLILTRGYRLFAAGLGVGLLAAIAASRGMAHVFSHVSSFEPTVLAWVVMILVVPAGLACWMPARRATKVDPLIAMRSE